MKLLYRFTGDPSCDWFYLTTVQVELECLPAVKVITISDIGQMHKPWLLTGEVNGEI